MVLSEATLSLLKQLGGVNNSVMLKAGKKQFSITEDQNVLGITTLEDDLPIDFGVYSMSQFLGNFSYIQNPQLAFNAEGNLATISGDIIQNYAACSPKAIKLPNVTQVEGIEKMGTNISFVLSQDTFNRILKLAANNLSTHIFFGGNEKGMYIRAASGKDDSNSTRVSVTNHFTGDAFEQAVKIEQLAMVSPDTYDIDIILKGTGGALRMKSQTKKFTYFLNFSAVK